MLHRLLLNWKSSNKAKKNIETEVFEQIDFDDIINQCAAVKEKRILCLKLSAEQKTFYPNNQEMPLVSDFNVFSCHFGHRKYRHRVYTATSP